MKRYLLAILFLFFTSTVYAADTKVSALTNISSPALGDDMYIVDNPDVTPLSRKISVGALLGVSPALNTDGTIVDDYVDSADYATDSIDNEHMNWANITNLGNNGAITVADTADATSYVSLWESATGDLGAKSDAGLTYNATTANLATTTFTGALTGNASTATLATTLTITDNESTAENNAILFTSGGDLDGGNLGIESDGTCYYTPSTGKITTTGFVGALTGNADTVTTNANLTGEVTSTGNAAVLDPTCISGKVDTTVVAADYLAFWDATDSTLKKVDAGELLGGTGDLKADGTVPLTANWDVGAYTIQGTQFISDIALGTAPFVVTSATEVANLKAATAGTSDAVTNATFTTALTVDTGTLTLTAAAANNSVLTIGAGAVSVSGANTGDNDEVGTLTTGDMCTNDGSAVQCTVNTEAELETAMDALDIVTVTANDITKANLETLVSGVADFAEADGDTWTGVHDAGGATSFEIPNTAGDLTVDAIGEIALDSTQKQIGVYDGTEVAIPLRHFIYGNLDLASWHDVDSDKPLIELDATIFPDGIVITGWEVDASVADPTTELDMNLMYCDDNTTGAFPGANPVLVDVMDTTTGNSSEATMSNSDLGSGTIPTGKILYLDMDADPTDANTFYTIKIEFYIPES